MKTNRNEPCPCGSGKKYKACCDKKTFNDTGSSKYFRWGISIAICIFVLITLWGIIGYFTSEHPEMEAYKCENPNCNLIHYRQVEK